MRFFNSIVISASALAALVSADIAFTDAPHGSAEAGQTYTLKWTGDTNQPATILLRKGPSNALVTVATVTSDATGGTFSWTVPKDIAPDGDYALQITAGSDTNYWQVGAIAGGVAATTTNSAASSASSSASSILSSASSKISSLSSELSSKLSSATASSTSAGTATVTSSRNSTSVTRATLTSTSTSGSSSTGTSSSSSSSSSTTSAPSNDGVNLKSNAALVLGAVAAMAYLG